MFRIKFNLLKAKFSLYHLYFKNLKALKIDAMMQSNDWWHR